MDTNIVALLFAVVLALLPAATQAGAVSGFTACLSRR
jgi:hypothetical protein